MKNINLILIIAFLSLLSSCKVNHPSASLQTDIEWNNNSNLVTSTKENEISNVEIISSIVSKSQQPDFTSQVIKTQLKENSVVKTKVSLKQINEARKMLKQLNKPQHSLELQNVQKTNCGSIPIEFFYILLGIILLILAGLTWLTICFPYLGLSVIAALILTIVILSIV